MTSRGSSSSRRVLATVGAAVLSLALVGCNSDASPSADAPSQSTGSSDTPESTAPPVSAAVISANVGVNPRNVAVDTPVKVTVTDGTLSDVVVSKPGKGTLKGVLNDDKTAWVASELLEPDMQYVISARAADPSGIETSSRTRFSTTDLGLDNQTYPSFSPIQGETVGVGMPVIIHFDVAVTDKSSIEKHLSVTTQPTQAGAWHWVNDNEIHWRPKDYWRPGTKVHAEAKINSISAGNGIYGQENRSVDFTVGQSVIMQANLSTDHMQVYVNGDLARTIAITGGKAGFETRSGTKLIIEKFEVKRMNSATVGIDENDPEFYDIPDVRFAQRVTYSGEFLHAAPWSISAQGSYNVSHGCMGMSTANAAWLYGLTHRGDPVQVTGTERGLEDGNGWTDWDMSFQEYQAGSAL